MPASAPGRQSLTRKGSPKRAKTRILAPPTLEPNRNYSVPQGALAVGVASITLWRAIYAGHCQHYRVGRRVLVSGNFLFEWLNSGGKTGHHAEKGGE